MNKRLIWLTIYAVAMAYLESAVVVYLRAIYYPEGFGFPLAKGGPMFWADREGLGNVYERLKGYYEVSGDPNLEPKPLLQHLAETGSSFADWSNRRG